MVNENKVINDFLNFISNNNKDIKLKQQKKIFCFKIKKI